MPKSPSRTTAKPAPPTPPEFPFPIGRVQTARTLIRMHQFLRGEIEKASVGEEVFVDDATCRTQMANIEGLLSFMKIDFAPQVLKAKRARPKIGPLDYGDLRRGVLKALKEAGDWQTYPEIAQRIIALHRLELDQPTRKHFLQKLREATHWLKSQGAVACEKPLRLGQTQELQRWKLAGLFD